MNIRFANQNDLDSVNALRKQVSSLHAAGKPEVFKPEFSQEVRDFLFQIWNDPEQEIVVAERDCQVCGYAVLHHINRPENPAKWEQDFLDIDEFGVDDIMGPVSRPKSKIFIVNRVAKVNKERNGQ